MAINGLTDRPVRLKQSAVLEPLICNWTAWSYLIAPLTSNLYFYRHQLPLLDSFLEGPDAHVAACADPALSGGPFVSLTLNDVPAVAAVRAEALRLHAPNETLAQELFNFSKELNCGSEGRELEPWYKRLPATLRPFIEIVYDYFHRPHVRILEPLLYRSPLYRPEAQCIRLFQLNRDSDRSYAFTTPRINKDRDFFLQVPFDSVRSRALVSLDLEPAPFAELCDQLAIDDEQGSTLAEFVEHVSTYRTSLTDNRYTYLGHASVLVKWRDINILIDPVVAARPDQGGPFRYTYADLPDSIDFVAITHNHYDHFSVETLLRLAPRIRTLLVPRAAGFLYGDVSLKAIAMRCNITNVIEMDAFDVVSFCDGEITAVPFLGEHCDLAHSKVSYVIRTGTQSALFGADADCINEDMYGATRAAVGKINTLFIGTEHIGGPLAWSCGPLLPQPPSRQQSQSRRSHGCDAVRALKMATILDAERVCVYAMGLEPWLRHILGTAMGPDSPQMHAAAELVQTARMSGLDARLLDGVASFD